MAQIPFTAARELAALLAKRELSAVEVMRAFLGQIERVNASVNAIVTLRPAEELLADAAAADRKLAAGDAVGPLHGLPIAIKDLSLTRGLRTTFGSTLYRNFVPTSDELYVERLRRAGAIVIGKTNTPEFGAGSQTFNALFGATRNPYDLGKTCGGSSGGAAQPRPPGRGLRRHRRRRRGGAGVRHATARRRHGSRRLAAQSRELLQRRRVQAVAGACAAAARAARRHARCAWADGAQRHGSR